MSSDEEQTKKTKKGVKEGVKPESKTAKLDTSSWPLLLRVIK